MKKNFLVIGIGFLLIGASIFSACTKEGPMGPAGANGTDGTNGTNGTDGTAGCITCHNPETVGVVLTEFQLSKHSFGLAAFEEAGNTTCAPCHSSEGFQYVSEHNTPATFTLGTSGTYANNYVSVGTSAIGNLLCQTCHSSLHTTYTSADIPALTTIAPVPMTMWGGTKTIDLAGDGHIGNLCVKCHQPRPLTTGATSAGKGNVLDYASLATNPTGIFFDPNVSTNLVKPSYRTGIHYGAAGAIYAGIGGVEFTGESYANSVHTSVASCQQCHMATQTGAAGGHTFVAKGNYAGCNETGCHSAAPLSATSSKVTDITASVKGKLDALAAKLKIGGIEILSRNPDSEGNLWYGKTTNNYDGYLNVYDPASNPEGEANNPGGVLQNPSPSSSWTAAQKTYNLTLPKLTLTNAQMGAIINFELCLRDYSLGIHNTSYTKALLNNSIAILP